MYCYRSIAEDLFWIGGNDRRLCCFEATYPVPQGVSYNAYLLKDDKTVVFDTVDQKVGRTYFANLAHLLEGRCPDYLIVQHMEPDHSAQIADFLRLYPQTTVVCNQKTKTMLQRFFPELTGINTLIVSEGTVLETGHHSLSFLMAPMVHWPEVMMTFDSSTGTLFSADAFGTFGALNGALFADEVDFPHEYLPEARRYYTNIVGKYGVPVTAVLKKAGALGIRMICPLHGFVWRENIDWYIEKYTRWSSYTPEETGVLIAYASVYGNTERAAEYLACRLREGGMQVVMYDTSVTHPSYILAQAFRFSHAVFAAPTYNGGVFVTMETLLHDLAAHGYTNRTVAIIENGSWAPAAAKEMKNLLAGCKNLKMLEPAVTVPSAASEQTRTQLEELTQALIAAK